MDQTVVDVNGLSRSFGPKRALDGVSFRATARNFEGSGSGTSSRSVSSTAYSKHSPSGNRTVNRSPRTSAAGIRSSTPSRTTMTAGLGPTIELTGDMGADMDVIRDFYRGKIGVRAKTLHEPRLREEDKA